MSYMKSLSLENRIEYKNKIQRIGFDPYDVIVNSVVLPTNINYESIFHYFTNEICKVSNQPRNNKKGIDGYKWFRDGWVCSVKGTIVLNYNVVHGRVSTQDN